MFNSPKGLEENNNFLESKQHLSILELVLNDNHDHLHCNHGHNHKDHDHENDFEDHEDVDDQNKITLRGNTRD